MSAAIYFVSGIDTEIGKTYATGYLAKLWTEQGQRVITQKLVQTGNIDISEDIQKHREIMGMGWFQEDHEKLTMPEIFTYPASPHLATRLDGRDLDFAKIEAATNELAQRFDPEKVMLNWHLEMLRTEKAASQERMVSTVFFHNENGYDYLSEGSSDNLVTETSSEPAIERPATGVSRRRASF